MTKLVILGAGSHDAVAAEAAVIRRKWESVSFLDDGAGAAVVSNVAPVQAVVGVPATPLQNYIWLIPFLHGPDSTRKKSPRLSES